ncbi:MAG: RNA 3'-terminal phosphate cyclase [Thaumarchaeota archaeon]|nr:RNA 3'-terminal phosphate cyclase [Nitrososphaerota archaeon]
MRVVEELEVDGSYGEGGGQILRTALTFSIVMSRPIHVSKIRAGRDPPGLRPQHAATVHILRDISGGLIEGVEVGSTEIRFAPGKIQSGEMVVDLKTAASITLLLQAVVPTVSISRASLDLTLVGGTDVPWSPTFDYLAYVTKPVLEKVGIDFEVEAQRRGYYPRGGGRVRAKIKECKTLQPLDLQGRTESTPVSIYSRCGGLLRHVAERQAKAAEDFLRSGGVKADAVSVSVEDSSSPGSSILISTVGSGCYIGSDSIGARGKTAESVGTEAAREFLGASRGSVAVDPHLADTLLPLLALAKGTSRLLVSEVTEHLRTSLHIAALFTNCEYEFEETKGVWLAEISSSKP